MDFEDDLFEDDIPQTTRKPLLPPPTARQPRAKVHYQPGHSYRESSGSSGLWTAIGDDEKYAKLEVSHTPLSISHSSSEYLGRADPQHRMSQNFPLYEGVRQDYTGSEYRGRLTPDMALAANFSSLEYPARASVYNRNSFLDIAESFRPAPQTNDYSTNLLEDADPFDDDSLFSDGENGESGPLPDTDEFKPRLNYTKTVKRAKLVRGNYVVDNPVPQALGRMFGQGLGGDETKFVRYLAVTCGPLNFGARQYDLRQNIYRPMRETEIFVCVTMYNENEILLARTLQGIHENLVDLSRRKDPVWGERLWQKIVVAIVVDGRQQLHERTLKLLAALGVYQELHAKSRISDDPVRAHLYEFTTPMAVERVDNRVHLGRGTPMQLMLCVKEVNGRKINLHRWCFQAFSPALRPKVVMLLDCGTKPGKDAFFHLWSAFKDPNVAGACGEMRVALGPGKTLLSNPLVAAQNFEYKISNVLDKPMELVFGFISVLPGAFSAYRWDALLNVDGTGPLEKYFKGEFLHGSAEIDPDDDEAELKERNFSQAGLFTSNMYLAEDRILCFELVAKKGKRFRLRYVSRAHAETDAPERIDDFVLQRRRWLNGSLFAAVYLVVHWTQIWRLEHLLARKLVLQLEFYYHCVTLVVLWFSLSCFFLVFRILTRNLGSLEIGFTLGRYISTAFLWVYVGCLVCTFVLAFGNLPRGTRKFYVTIAVLFAVLMAYLLFGAVYLAVRTVHLVQDTVGAFNAGMLFTNQKLRDLVLSVLSTYLMYGMAAVIHGEPLFMVTSFFQYLLLLPLYVNMLNIYAFCNIHDISWGNRDTPQARELGAAKVSGTEATTVAVGSPEELEKQWGEMFDDLKVPAVEVVEPKKPRDDSYYAFVRTVMVLLWMLTNAILVAVVMAAGSDPNDIWNDSRNATIFLSVVLWLVCGLAVFRFVGSVLYVVLNMGRPLRWWIQLRRTVA